MAAATLHYEMLFSLFVDVLVFFLLFFFGGGGDGVFSLHLCPKQNPEVDVQSDGTTYLCTRVPFVTKILMRFFFLST